MVLVRLLDSIEARQWLEDLRQLAQIIDWDFDVTEVDSLGEMDIIDIILTRGQQD